MNGILEKLASQEFRLKSVYWFKIALYVWLLLGNILIFPYRHAFFSQSSLIQDYTKTYQEHIIFTFIFQEPFRSHQMIFFYVQTFFLLIGICNFVPRFTHAIIYVLTMNLWNKAWVTMDGGNNLLSIIMFFMLFMNMSGKQQTWKNRLLVALQPTTIVAHNVFLLACLLQVVTVYITAGYLKADGNLWQNGMALYYILQSDTYSTPMAGLLVSRYPELSVIGSYFTQIFQLTFPTLVWFKKTRPYVFIAGIMLHMGIAIAMGLFLFGLAMIITYVLFLDDDDITKISQKHKSIKIVVSNMVSGMSAAFQKKASTVDRNIQSPIFFFDDKCGLCSRFVRLVHCMDSKKKIAFAPIGGKHFSDCLEIFGPQSPQEAETSYFYNGYSLFSGPRGIMEAIKLANPRLGILVTLFFFPFPNFVQEFIYRVIASHRKRVGGVLLCEMAPLSLRRQMIE